MIAIVGVTTVGTGPSGADQVSTLQAKARQLSQELIREQLQMGALEQQYSSATARVQADAAHIARTRARIAADQRRVEHDRLVVRGEAITAYVDMTAPSGQVTQLFSNNMGVEPVRAEYQQIAVGSVDVAVDLLHTSQHALEAQESTLEQQQAADQSAQSQAAALVQQSQATQSQIQSQQRQVTGQLAAAIAQQRAAEAAAVAAAIHAAQVAAAEQAAARQAAASQATPADTTTSSSAPTTSTTDTPTTGTPTTVTTPPASTTTTTVPSSGDGTSPALNSFLQCALQAESSGNYGAVSPNGQYMGGFQFSQATWNEAAQLAGMPNLVGVPPNQATPAEQDTLAVALYALDGETPWDDPCRN